MQRLIAAGLLALTLTFSFGHQSSVNLWPVLFEQLASDPSGGGNSGGGGG